MAGIPRVLRLRSFPVAPDGIIDRLSGEDLMELTADVGPVPWQVGAILHLDPGGKLTLSTVRELISERVTAVPRLRQVLVRSPWGCGRPIWVDDPAFDVRRHVGSVSYTRVEDRSGLCDTSVTVAMQRLPWNRPLWRLTLITGMDDTPLALVVVFHHVLADGIGGLAVLARLLDGAPTVAATGSPRPAPTRACRGRLSYPPRGAFRPEHGLADSASGRYGTQAVSSIASTGHHPQRADRRPTTPGRHPGRPGPTSAHRACPRGDDQRRRTHRYHCCSGDLA